MSGTGAVAAHGADHEVFRPPPPQVRSQPLLRIHGYAKPEAVRTELREQARIAAAEAMRLADPEVRFRSLGIRECTCCRIPEG